MTNIVSPATRILLVQSLRAVETREGDIRRALSRTLTRSASDPELSDAPDIVATLLLSFLIEQVRHIVAGRAPGHFAIYRTEHQLHDIDGRHYSRFGDVLEPVLAAILGPTHSPETPAAWCDAFWALVRQLQQDEALVPQPVR